MNNDSDSSGNNLKISVNNSQKLKQQAFRSGNKNGPNGGSTTIKVNDGNSCASTLLKANKLNNSSIIFLGDCEMPITKSGVVEHKNSVGSDSSANKAAGGDSNNKYTQKIHISSNGGGGELKQQFAASSQQTR